MSILKTKQIQVIAYQMENVLQQIRMIKCRMYHHINIFNIWKKNFCDGWMFRTLCFRSMKSWKPVIKILKIIFPLTDVASFVIIRKLQKIITSNDLKVVLYFCYGKSIKFFKWNQSEKSLAMSIAYTNTVACIGKYWENIVKMFLWKQIGKILKILPKRATLEIYLLDSHCERG